MKICLISNLFPPISRGGAEKVAKIVADGLKSAGHEVFVISTKPLSGWESLKPTVADEGGIKVYRFYPANIFYYLNDWKHNALWRAKWHFWDMFNFHSRAMVKKILKKERPEIVMTHNLMGIGFLVPGAIRGLRVKHVHTLHDVQLAVPSGLIIKGKEESWEQRTWLRKIYEVVCRWLFGSPDVVVSPSKWLMDFYAQKGFFKNSKKIVLPNPTVAAPFSIASSFEKNESEENDKLSLLYLGQIEEHKGILFLIKTLSKFFHDREKILVREAAIDWQLHIVGNGSKMEEVKKMVGDDKRFIVHGKLPSEKIAKIFNEVDLTIVP